MIQQFDAVWCGEVRCVRAIVIARTINVCYDRSKFVLGKGSVFERGLGSSRSVH